MIIYLNGYCGEPAAAANSCYSKNMANRFSIEKVGDGGGIAWLIRAEHSAVLVDTGFPYYGKALAKELEISLGGIPLSSILITHSHYDHAGGLSRVKAAFPEAVVYAAAHAQQVLQREGALKAMRELNRTAAALADGDFEISDEDVGGYMIDRTPGDGDQLRTEDFLIEVWETPGHTNDSLSYWFPRESLMVLSETTGVLLKRSPMFVEPAFIVSWKSSVAAVERVEKIMPQTILVPHTGYLSGDDVKEYLQKQKEAILETKELVFRLSAEGKTEDEILAAIQSLYYDIRPPSLKACQPLSAFLLNFKAMIPRALAEGP